MPLTDFAFSTFSFIRSLIVVKIMSLFNWTDDADAVDDSLVLETVADFFISFKST